MKVSAWMLPVALALGLIAVAGAQDGRSTRFEVSAGYGFASLGEMVFRSQDDSGKEVEKTGDGESMAHHGFDLAGSYAFSRWFGAMVNVSGAYTSGEFQLPGTIWTGGVILVIPGAKQEGSRTAHAFLAGIRIKDRDCPWIITPSAYVLAGMMHQTLQIDPEAEGYSTRHDTIYFQGAAITQNAFAMALGVAADLRIYKGIGLRVGADYLPVFAGEKTVVDYKEKRRLLGVEKQSLFKVTLDGGVRQDFRVRVGPYWGF
jgi:hypothetical protein